MEGQEGIGRLDQDEGVETLVKMKKWTDQVALSEKDTPAIAYQFEGDRPLPIHCAH